MPRALGRKRMQKGSPARANGVYPCAAGKANWQFLFNHSMKSAIAIASIALSLGLHYFRTITYPSAKRRLEMHASIIDGTAPSQYRHRVLMPYLAEGIVKATQFLLLQETDRPTRQGSQKAILLAYFLLETSAIFVGLFATFLLCGIWLEPPWPLLAALLEGAVMPLTFHDAFFHPWSQAEFGFFSVGLLLAARNRWRQLALLVALAALNRETSVFLVLAVFFVALPDRRRRRWAVACSAIWAVIFAGLRIVLGFTTHLHDRDGHPREPERVAPTVVGRPELRSARRIVGVRRYGVQKVAGIPQAGCLVRSLLLRSSAGHWALERGPVLDRRVPNTDPHGGVLPARHYGSALVVRRALAQPALFFHPCDPGRAVVGRVDQGRHRDRSRPQHG